MTREFCRCGWKSVSYEDISGSSIPDDEFKRYLGGAASDLPQDDLVEAVYAFAVIDVHHFPPLRRHSHDPLQICAIEWILQMYGSESEREREREGERRERNLIPSHIHSLITSLSLSLSLFLPRSLALQFPPHFFRPDSSLPASTVDITFLPLSNPIHRAGRPSQTLGLKLGRYSMPKDYWFETLISTPPPTKKNVISNLIVIFKDPDSMVLSIKANYCFYWKAVSSFRFDRRTWVKAYTSRAWN